MKNTTLKTLLPCNSVIKAKAKTLIRKFYSNHLTDRQEEQLSELLLYYYLKGVTECIDAIRESEGYNK